MPGQHTIHDLARELGVSARSISRVLNKQPGVAPETRARILRRIEESGFQPHSAARSLRTHEVDCIGVVLASPPEAVPLSQELLSWIFSELYRLFGRSGRFLSFDLQGNAGSGRRDYARGIWQRRFGACVIAGAFSLDDVLLQRIHQSGHPYVALARLHGHPECNTATVDYEEAAYLSTRFLLERGHTRIGMLQGLPGFQPGWERQQGYLRAHAESGKEADERLIRPVPFEAQEIAQTAHRLLSNHEVTALVDCSGAQDAAALREGAQRAGRRLGADADVVVWSYTMNATILAEAAAHVWLPVRESASEGMELLARWLDGSRRAPIQVLYRPRLYVGTPGGEIPRPQPVFTVQR